MQTRQKGQYKVKLTLSPRLCVKPLKTVITRSNSGPVFLLCGHLSVVFEKKALGRASRHFDNHACLFLSKKGNFTHDKASSKK